MNGIHEYMKNILRAVFTLAAVVAGSIVMTGAAHADTTTNKSDKYTEECFNKGVPLPPVWGAKNNFWKYSGQLPASDIFVDLKTPTDIYYFLSSPTNADGSTNLDYTLVNGELHLPQNLKNPEGVCMAAIRKAANTQTCDGQAGQSYSDAFSVICQGKNGNACFWSLKNGNTIPWSGAASGKALQPPYSSATGIGSGPQCYKTTFHPNGKKTDFANGFQVNSFDIYIVQYQSDSENFDNRSATNNLPSWVGGASLVGNKEGICTACHAGENVFINHPGTATDINPLSAGRKTSTIPTTHYFPTNWPNPIVPSADTLMSGAAWPQNPRPIEHYNGIHPANGCFSCHAQGQQGGRFPKISDLAALDTGNLTKNYCHNVLLPSITRTGAGGGAMPPGTGSQAIDTDSFAKSMWYNLCVSSKVPKSAESGLTAAVDSNRGKIHKSAYQTGFHEHYFNGKFMPSAGSFFSAKDKICVDGFVSSSSNLTPSQVAIQFEANDGPAAGNTWNHRAYWGSNSVGPIQSWPVSGSVGNFQVSTKATPKGRGYWNQYCVNAGSVGLTQKNISGIKFTLFNGAMWWGNVYYYSNGGGAPRQLFTIPSGVTKGVGGSDYWQIVNTPAYLYWNPATWHHLVSGEGNYQMDQTGNVDLGKYTDNYCYMNSLGLRAGDQISFEAKRNGPLEWWSLGANFNAVSGASTIGANCIPWKELTTATTRTKTAIPPLTQEGMHFSWNAAGVDGQQANPGTVLVGGSFTNNLCMLSGLRGAFSSTRWSDVNIYGISTFDSASAWYRFNKTPEGHATCGNIGIDTLTPRPASAATRGGIRWFNLNQNWSGSNGSIDVSALSGVGKDANNQFCYLVGLEPSAAIPSTATPSVYVVVADGTSTYKDSSGNIIPAGRWVVWGQGGMSWARVGCQSTPI